LHSSAERGQLARANSLQTSSVNQRESLPAAEAVAAGLITTAPARDGVTASIAQYINLNTAHDYTELATCLLLALI